MEYKRAYDGCRWLAAVCLTLGMTAIAHAGGSISVTPSGSYVSFSPSAATVSVDKFRVRVSGPGDTMFEETVDGARSVNYSADSLADGATYRFHAYAVTAAGKSAERMGTLVVRNGALALAREQQEQ